MIGDAWQWIPFIFIVLLAALESQPRDQVEAAMVDGASRWQIFRDMTWPAIVPVAATVVLIRVIEAFKIVDLPNVLTNGGPGIATGIADAARLHRLAHARSRRLGRGRLYAALRLDRRCRLLLQLRRHAGPRRGRACMRASARLGSFRAGALGELTPATAVLSTACWRFWTFVVLFPLYWVVITSFKLPIDVTYAPVLPALRRLPALAPRLALPLRRCSATTPAGPISTR